MTNAPENSASATHTMDMTNPISLYHSGGLTKKQSDAYNALLTQVAKIVTNLQSRVTANSMLDPQSNAVACWQYILNDIVTVILPEFYVVFHDKTTIAMQRRRLYDMTQAIYFAMVEYDKAVFLQKIALCDVNNKLAIEALRVKPASAQGIDAYMTGQGPNAHLAYELRAMADFVTVDAIYYLDKFVPYYNLLINEKRLLQCLTDNSLEELKNKLDELQKKRYLALSVPASAVVMRQPVLREAKNPHLLATWILQDYLHSNHSNKQRSNSQLSNSNLTTLGQNTALSKNSQWNVQHLVKDPEPLKKGAKLAAISVVGMGVLLSNSFILAVISSIIFLPMMFGARRHITDGLDIEGNGSFIKSLSIIALILCVPALLSGGFMAAAAVQAFILAESLLSKSTEKLLNRSAEQTLPSPTTDSLIVNQHGSGSYRKMTQKFDAIKNTAVDVDAEAITPAKNYDLPLALERHGYHLAILLSPTPTKHLEQLIAAANKLYAHLDYLQSAHPYLANRVDELLNDLTHNTIVRLDEMASQFVKDGQANSDAQALFAEQHEARIDKLIVLNLNQVNDLNQTILEKQMAGFADIGNDEERRFRNSVMELKILLRWMIAQQPDEIQASSHQVILSNLQSTTLADMQAAFFDPKTTTEQRAQLQNQLNQLLTHFKQQTTHDIQLHSSHDNERDIQELLQLSKSSAISEPHNDIDTASSQSKTQQFIELNKQYIKQLRAHWH